jgi:hypothetical protein
MFQRITMGWQLIKQAIQVLRLDKELLLFPLISGISCLLVLASFAVPAFLSGALDAAQENQENVTQNAVAWVVLFLFYFVNYFVITFFNSALVGCAVIRLKGGDPVVGDGFRAAFARLPQIAGWALVSATVGILLKMIESRSERVGQIIVSLLGMAWSITTFFVVPVLVIEGLGPIDSVKRSVTVIRKTWGEALVANYGIGFLVMLLSLLGILPIVGGIALAGSGSTAIGGVLIGLGVLILITVALISSALNSIILAALYIYAAEDKMPEGFDSNLVRGAFANK